MFDIMKSIEYQNPKIIEPRSLVPVANSVIITLTT